MRTRTGWIFRRSRLELVNTGIVIAGTLGGPGRLDYTVLGDPVNIAQRLQATAVGGEILATAATVREAGADQAEPVGLKQLKGRQEACRYLPHPMGSDLPATFRGTTPGE